MLAGNAVVWWISFGMYDVAAMLQYVANCSSVDARLRQQACSVVGCDAYRRLQTQNGPLRRLVRYTVRGVGRRWPGTHELL